MIRHLSMIWHLSMQNLCKTRQSYFILCLQTYLLANHTYNIEIVSQILLYIKFKISSTLDAPQFLIRRISLSSYNQSKFLMPQKLYTILIEERRDIRKILHNMLLKTIDIFVT